MQKKQSSFLISIGAYSNLIDWQREAEKEEEKMRFCPGCGQVVAMRFRGYTAFELLFRCPKCGDIIRIKRVR